MPPSKNRDKYFLGKYHVKLLGHFVNFSIFGKSVPRQIKLTELYAYGQPRENRYAYTISGKNVARGLSSFCRCKVCVVIRQLPWREGVKQERGD